MAGDWVEAWNGHDLDRIMSHYHPEVVFAAPTVVGRWGRPDGTLSGAAEVREHFRQGLERVPNLHFTPESVLVGPRGYCVIYVRENGNKAADVVEIDGTGLVVSARAFYTDPQA